MTRFRSPSLNSESEVENRRKTERFVKKKDEHNKLKERKKRAKSASPSSDESSSDSSSDSSSSSASSSSSSRSSSTTSSDSSSSSTSSGEHKRSRRVSRKTSSAVTPDKHTAAQRSKRSDDRPQEAPRSAERVRRSSSGGARRKRTPTPPKPVKVHVGHLTRNVTKAHIQEIFSHYGTVKYVEFPTERFNTNLNRGFCYVEFENCDGAEKAMKHMDGGQIDGQEITCAPILLPRIRSRRSPPVSSARRPYPPLNFSSRYNSSRYRRRSPPYRRRSPPRRSRTPPRRSRTPPRRSRSPRRSRTPPRRRRRSSSGSSR